MSGSTLTRRGVLVSGATASALLACGAAAAPAQAETVRRGKRYAEHLLRRATYGPTPEALAEIDRLGANTWLDRQLNPAQLADPGGDAVRALFPELGWSIRDARTKQDDFGWDLMFAVGQATLAQAAWSSRQLFEVMVDFWSNHLNVTNPSDNVWDNRHAYDRDVIRRHALGRFEDMLVASAKHPAMLRYLDNADSTKEAPNENYGRELLELHTVGVDGGYDEAMMLDSARIMTGWTVDTDTGEAYYDGRRHWTGRVRVLDFSDANTYADGRDVAHRYLSYLARHPKTAEQIARKLAVRFVADEPPASLVASLAQVYLEHGTAIRPVLRALFRSDEFRAAPGKVRRPYEDLLATIRILGISPLQTGDTQAARDGLRALYWMVDDAGQAPGAWGLPDGYPDVAAAWQSAAGALARWNFHQGLASGWWPNKSHITVANCSAFLPATLPTTYGGLVDALSKRLVLHRLPDAHRDAVLTFCTATETTPLHSSDEWLHWRLPYLCALILDAPGHLTR